MCQLLNNSNNLLGLQIVNCLPWNLESPLDTPSETTSSGTNWFDIIHIVIYIRQVKAYVSLTLYSCSFVLVAIFIVILIFVYRKNHTIVQVKQIPSFFD
jgi:hypothetical protein